MAGELFKAMAGVDIVHVPYKGSGGARTGVLGGQVEMMFDAVTTMSENVKAGKVKALGTTGKTPSPVLPGVPTIAEAGVPGYEAVIWLGVIAPKNTPREIVNRLNARDHEDREQSGYAGRVEQAGCRADDDDAGRILPLPDRRHRQMGAHREDLGRQAGPVNSGSARPASLSARTRLRAASR